MKRLKSLSLILGLGCLTGFGSAYAPDAVLRSRAQHPLRPYIGYLRRAPIGPLRFLRKDLWEWETSPFDGRDAHMALFGREYVVHSGSSVFTYEPSLQPASSLDDFYSGLHFTWANRLRWDWALGGGSRIYVRERAYINSYQNPGTNWVDGYYANPVFENRLTAALEFPIGGSGIVGTLPIHAQLRSYGDCPGGKYSGKVRTWIWIAPQVSFPLSNETELITSFQTETFISSRTGRWYIADAFAEGVVELTLKVKL